MREFLKVFDPDLFNDEQCANPDSVFSAMRTWDAMILPGVLGMNVPAAICACAVPVASVVATLRFREPPGGMCVNVSG